MIREDLPDLVYRNEKGKFNALIDEIVELQTEGRPVLVGTISVEKSEQLSEMLKRRGIRHEVLNAKLHEKEAGVVAQAGKSPIAPAEVITGDGDVRGISGRQVLALKAEIQGVAANRNGSVCNAIE